MTEEKKDPKALLKVTQAKNIGRKTLYLKQGKIEPGKTGKVLPAEYSVYYKSLEL